MKYTKFILLFVILIMSAFVVSATNSPRYGLNVWTGNSNVDTYNLRSTPSNPVNYNDLNACAVGYGTDMGTYPITLDYNGNNYYYLVVPTTNSIRIVNSNCSEINNIAISDVSLYGTLANFVDSDGLQKYVVMGYNSSDSMYSFYSYKFNTATLQLEFEKKVDISTNIDTVHFNGVACGWETESFNVDGGCGIVNASTLYYWDIGSDIVTEYTTPHVVERNRGKTNLFGNANIPYGTVIDIDNDNNNEMFFGAATTTNNVYVSFDMVSKTFDYTLNDAHGHSNNNMKGVPVTPCQLGGRVSNFEICYMSVKGYTSDTIDGYYADVYDLADVKQISISGSTTQRMLPVTVDADLDGNMDLLINGELYDEDYNNLGSALFTGSWSDIQPYCMELTGDGLMDCVTSNGALINSSGDRIESYNLTFLSDSKEGYLVAGRLNSDLENELIYSDSNNIYIYSSNPTEDYIFIGDNATGTVNCTYATIPTEGECDSLLSNFESGSNDCTTELVYDCYNSIVGFDCSYSETPTNTECADLFDGYISGSNDCNSFIVGSCLVAIPESSEELTTANTGLPFILGALQENIKLIFGLAIIIFLIISTALAGVKEPIVLIFVGIVGAIITVMLGLIDPVVLIVIIVVLLLLMLLGMTILKKRE